MRTTTHWMFALFAAATVAAGWPATADASHPSKPKWSAEQPEGTLPGCLGIEVIEGREGLIEFSNMCPDTWAIDSATCEPAICDFDKVEIQSGATKRIGPSSFGLDADALSEGESVVITTNPTLGGSENPEITLTFTLDGWTDASHDVADATGDTGGGDAGGDVAPDSDAGADASDGEDTPQAETDDAGCSTAGGSTPSPLPFAILLLVALRRSRRP